MKILIADAFDASLPKRLEKFGEVTSDLGQVGTATVLLCRSKTKVTKEMVDQAAAASGSTPSTCRPARPRASR
jgi:D-3-phosphoglycerate dehydrogenase